MKILFLRYNTGYIFRFYLVLLDGTVPVHLMRIYVLDRNIVQYNYVLLGVRLFVA